MPIEIRVEFNRLPQVADLISRQADVFMDTWVERGVNYAKDQAPQDTGYLHDHIDKDAPDRDTRVMFSEADYSAAVNFGALGRPAQPFFTQAVERIRAEAEDIAASVYRDFEAGRGIA